MYAGSGTSSGTGNGIYLTIDGGGTWIPLPGGPSTGIQTIKISYSNPFVLYVGTYTQGMYKSTNGGANWIQIDNGLIPETSRMQIQAICIKPDDPNTVVITIWDGLNQATQGVFKTTNGGVSWVPSNNGLGVYRNFLSLACSPLQPNTIYMGSSSPIVVTQYGPTRIFKSYNFGSSWINSSTGMDTTIDAYCPVRDLSISSIDTNVILAGLIWNYTTLGGPWVSTNAGSLWIQKTNGFADPVAPIRSVLIEPSSNNKFYIGATGSGSSPGGVWTSTNGGDVWFNINHELMDSNHTVRSLAFRTTDSTLFAGVSDVFYGTPGIFEYSFNLVGKKNLRNNSPISFSLSQNYPNPFNPITKIKFSIPNGVLGQTFLSVYDIIGREIAKLVNEKLSPGTYEVEFDGSNYPSGVYFYKLKTETFNETKRMVLIK
jgi:photosystem II stability/assembly factor-like uncharacterized protein